MTLVHISVAIQNALDSIKNMHAKRSQLTIAARYHEQTDPTVYNSADYVLGRWQRDEATQWAKENPPTIYAKE